jgi:hypothetical protein
MEAASLATLTGAFIAAAKPGFKLLLTMWWQMFQAPSGEEADWHARFA